MFRLPYQISQDHQHEIMEATISEGKELGSRWGWGLLVRGNELKPSIDYDSRFDPEIDWRYTNYSISPLVRELVEPLSNFMEVTRIKIFIQKPGFELKEHCDKLTTLHCQLFKTFFLNTQFNDFLIREDLEPKTTLGVRIPISYFGQRGKPYFRYKNKRYGYDPENSYFAFDDSNILHGALPVDYPRGVIFIDGVIDSKKLESISLEPMNIFDFVSN